MKLRVIGWADYDDDLPEGDNGWAARNAIIDEIRAHGYEFSGWHHQEGAAATPVLNDGRKYCYSRWGWGDVMAEAHGLMGPMDYARYAFAFGEDRSKCPKRTPFCPEAETDLAETYEREVSEEDLARAEEGGIAFSEYEYLRYLYTGDTLVLTSHGSRTAYRVKGAHREHNREKEPAFLLIVSLEKL